MNRNGFATIVIFVIAIIVLLVGGIWYYEMNHKEASSQAGSGAPVITSISPTSGCLEGTTLIITGHGFGSQDTVAFGVYGETMTVSSTGESIVVNMPPPGPPAQRGGPIQVPIADPVTVISNGMKSNAVIYTLTCGENTTNP